MKTILAIAVLLACNLAHAATSDLSSFKFFSSCGPQGTEDSAGPWPGGATTNLWITGICPHPDPDGGEPDVPLELKLLITRLDNQPFSFLSFQTYNDSIEIRSSNGGYIETEFTQRPNTDNDPDWVPHPDLRQDPTYNFSGSYWTDLLWLEFDYRDDPDPETGNDGNHSHMHYHLANFQFGTPAQVPEPATWELFALLAGGLGFRWKFRNVFWKKPPQ